MVRGYRIRLTAAAGTLAAALALHGGGSDAIAQADCANADAGPGQPAAVIADAIACLIDRERAGAGLPALTRDARLAASAAGHAGDMVSRNYFGADTPEGRSPSDRASAAGYPQGAAVAETIYSATEGKATPRSAVARWMSEAGSRSRLLARAGSAIGVGVASGVPGDASANGYTLAADVGAEAPTAPGVVVGKTAVAEAVRGVVYVESPGGTRSVLRAAPRGARASRYRQVTDTTTIRIGSRIDTRKGVLRMTTAADLNGGTQTADFGDGMFKLGQRASSSPVTELSLIQPLVACRSTRASAARQGSTRRKVRRRSLFGSGKGRYRTRGRYASATVRGTTWRTTDSCAGTKVSVTSGVVTVQDRRTGRSVDVSAGRSLLVPRRPRN